MTIKAIETRYKGYRFRSRLEARWAVFFDALDLQWEYEPEGFDLGKAGLYLPDFYVSNIGIRSTNNAGMWFEIKGKSPNDEENAKCMALAEQSGKSAGILYGQISNDFNSLFIECSGGDRWDIGMTFMKCINAKCGRVKFEFSESNYMTCETCGHGCLEDHVMIQRAVNKARAARFEHGESPR